MLNVNFLNKVLLLVFFKWLLRMFYKGVYRTSIETWPLNIFFSKNDIDLGLFFLNALVGGSPP